MKHRIGIWAHWDKYNEKFIFSADDAERDFTGIGYVKVHEQEVEFESPADRDLKAKLVIAKRAQQAKIKAAAFEECSNIEEEIQELLALEAPK